MWERFKSLDGKVKMGIVAALVVFVILSVIWGSPSPDVVSS